MVKRYGQDIAVGPVDLRVAAGRRTVLIGPSGCGKSTLLRLLNGLIEPSEGQVLFDDEPITAKNALRLRQRMGYVIQDGGLFPHMTARRNASVMARFVGVARTEIDKRIAELAELVRLSPDLLDRYPAQLSGGQKQRVSLMRALMLDPEVLLLDEPMGALDPLIRYELQEDLLSAFEALGKTVVLVTHDISEAWYFGHELVLLKAGQIVQTGSLEDMKESPADPFVTRFLEAQRSPLS